jgi:hypothetical protein
LNDLKKKTNAYCQAKPQKKSQANKQKTRPKINKQRKIEIKKEIKKRGSCSRLPFLCVSFKI